MKILKKMVTHLQRENMTVDDAYNCITEDNKFDTIRVEEPDLFGYKPLPLLQFIMPTFGRKSLIRENKTIGLDKVPLPELSLNQFLTMRNADDNNQKLKILQKRYCRFSKQNISRILKERQEQRAMN